MKLNKQKVIELMTEKNIKNQTELAEQLSISKSQLSNMFSVNYNPIRTNVSKLAERLGVYAVDLFSEDEFFENIFDRYAYKQDLFAEVKNVRPKRKFYVLETFAGAGGLALGLEKSGFESVGAIEFDKNAAQTLRDNRPDWNIIEENIEKVAEIGIRKFIDADDVDVLSGGYPCQSFSYAGKRAGFADTRGTLFYPYSEILRQLNPKVFIAENVKGLVNHDHGKTLETMIQTFEEAGYQVYWNVLNSWYYDVAQKRERIVIIGIRNDLVEKQKYPFFYPKVQDYQPVLKDVLKNVPESEGTEYSESKKKVMSLVPPGGSWVNLPEEIAQKYMGASWFSGGGKRGMARRLSWDEPSLTLTTSPSQKQTERCHPDETRPFTTREYARIQSFPDDWQFSGGVGATYKQIGNAVPVNMAEYVGKAVINYLNQFEEK